MRQLTYDTQHVQLRVAVQSTVVVVAAAVQMKLAQSA